MPLKMAPLGEEVEIRRLSADEKVKRHLENLGLAVGQKVTVLSVQGGAVILKVKDGRMALDRYVRGDFRRLKASGKAPLNCGFEKQNTERKIRDNEKRE